MTRTLLPYQDQRVWYLEDAAAQPFGAVLYQMPLSLWSLEQAEDYARDRNAARSMVGLPGTYRITGPHYTAGV